MFLRKKIQLILALFLLATSSLAVAGGESKPSAFVDSMHDWGAWDLGLEPAAGGPAPMSDRALNVRLANVKFRPNDNTTFSPGAAPIVVATPVPPARLPTQPPVRLDPTDPPPTASPADLF